MRAAARLGWRVAAVVAFGATAALAVTLTRGAPMHAALISARNHDAAPRCAASGLRISLGAVPAAATGLHRGPTSYVLDFTNVSDAKCDLLGYPAVAAYLAGGQVGNAAAPDTTATAHRVVLAPGETARAAVIASAAGSASAAAGGCRPVIATGLRVTPPGESAARFIRHSLLACSAAGPRAPVFLRVRAVQPYPAAGKLDSLVQPASRPRIGSRAARIELRKSHRAAGALAPGEPVLASGLAG